MAGVGSYGAAGLVGVLTPQANPAAESELSLLLDPDVAMVTGRLMHPAAQMLQRLRGYGENLGAALVSLRGMPVDAYAFACTGTSYLYDDAGLDFEGVLGALGGAPVVSAASAIEAALIEAGARRLALVSPYPEDLTALARTYWLRRGYVIGEVARPQPASGGHPIYSLTAGAMRRCVMGLTSRPDAIVLMGTGVPTLPAIDAADPAGPPTLSSNVCLAWKVSAVLRGAAAPTFQTFCAVDAPWRGRLRARFPALSA